MKNNICYQHLHWIHDEEVFVKRVIVCAANKYTLTTGEELVVPCVRHANPVLQKQVQVLIDAGMLEKSLCKPRDQGFIDQYYNWWSREDAFIIAEAAQQINHERNGDNRKLFSEGLY